MSRLTPEPRVDVNGRVVTRHVLSDSPSPRPRKGRVPLPTGLRSDSHRAVSDLVVNILRDYLPMRVYSPIHERKVNSLSRREIDSYFEGVSREVIDECINQMFKVEANPGYQSLLLSAVYNREDSNVLSDITFLYESEKVIAIDDEWHEAHDIALNHLNLRAMLKGIRSYDRWGLVIPERLQLASKEQQKIVSALYQTTDMIDAVIGTNHLNTVFDKNDLIASVSLRDKDIFDVIVAHADSSEEIQSFLATRGCNGKLLAEYFDGDRPLRNGIL